MDFGERIESRGARIREMEKVDVLGGKTIETANILEEGMEDLHVGVGRVIREKMVSGRVRQLYVGRPQWCCPCLLER